MKYLLDTSVLIHSLLAKPNLSQRAISLLGDVNLEFYLSVASCWELVIKTRSGKLVLPDTPAEFLTRALKLMLLQSLEITQLHALAVAELPDHHRDPFDRMLIAQANVEGMTLLTSDRVFGKYKVEQFYCGH
jgi:PIN domain nuclease of toxin-antitoxin system